MSQRNISHLGKPARRFRIDIGKNARTSGFEKLNASRKEDLKRATLLRKAARSYPETIDREAALALAAKLEAAGNGGEVPESLACSTYMRGQRINISGAMLKFINESRAMKAQAVTIIPVTWEFAHRELGGVLPMLLLAALRASLYEKGAAQANGWLICFIHGEYDAIAKVFRLHVHGYAYGEMVQVVDRLRLLPNYKTQRYLRDGSLSPVYRRVQIRRKPSTSLPKQVTYRLQSYWPSRAIIIRDDKRIRARQKQRIDEPYHSQMLLWLDQWKISDLTLMIGLRVTKDGLIQTKRST